jgi:hypothetical protein
MLEQNIRLLIHTHEYGTSVHPFTGAIDKDAEQIAELLEIDFEPAKEEFVEVVDFDYHNISELE